MRSSERVTNRRVVVLLAEDDPGDQALTRRALQHDNVQIDLRIVENGEHGSSGAAPIAREIIKTYLLSEKPRSPSEQRLLTLGDTDASGSP